MPSTKRGPGFSGAMLRSRGFDKSRYFKGFGGRWQAACSKCSVMVINGIATHENGCQNAVHECVGCNSLIPMRQKYCEACS